MFLFPIVWNFIFSILLLPRSWILRSSCLKLVCDEWCQSPLILTDDNCYLQPTMLSITIMSSPFFFTAKFHVKLLLLILSLILYHNGVCAWYKLLRAAILPPHLSPWCHLLDRRDAASFLLMTGLTRKAFYMIYDILKLPGHPARPKTKGCKFLLSLGGQLGLLLFYLGSTVNYKYLCLLFGVTPSVCSCILRTML